MDNQQEQIILLAQLCANKDMQVFLLNKEKELKEQLSRLKGLEEYKKEKINLDFYPIIGYNGIK